jgi:hypothetical protein
LCFLGGIVRRFYGVIVLILTCFGGQIAVAENVLERNALPNVVDYVLNCFAQEQNSTGLVLVEKISDYDECQQISKLGFLFDFYKLMSLSDARHQIVGLVNDLLLRINSNVKLKKYLAVSPFTAKDVVIRLRLRNKDCGFLYPPLGNIAYVSAIDGVIIYDTVNSFTYDLDTLRTESFADAIKISASITTP